MGGPSKQLLEYIQEQHQLGVSVVELRRVLLANDWQDDIITQAFLELNLREEQVPENISPIPPASANDPFYKEGITMDKIIEKFIPIAGALMLIVGFGYLIYANAWVHLSMEIRIGLGFFFSVAIIGGSFSLSERMKDMTDIGIGSGVLLLYGTLIYGSRTTELATAMIPEVVTLLTAVVFTVLVCYFASRRNSKIILILGMLGAYITPFVIGQNDVWVENISFNAYLLYFLATNAAVFLIGREISVRDIIPLNILGLFVGVTALWGLSISDGINEVGSGGFFSGEFFTAVLFMLVSVFSVWSILLSAKRFKESDDGYLSLGYIAPIIWFAFNVSALDSVSDVTIGVLYALISASCFVGWHVLLGTETRFQHTALYAAGLVSAFLAVFAFFQEFDVLTSILIAYSSLIFAFLYLFDSSKSERMMSYVIVSLAGSILSLQHILESDSQFQTLLIVVALIPAMSTYFVAKAGKRTEYEPASGAYSVVWSIVALMFVLAEFIDYIDTEFLLFYLVPLLFLLYLGYVQLTSPTKMSLDARSRMLRTALIWFALGFIGIFFTLIINIYPAPKDVYLFTHPDLPTDWLLIKGIFGTAILLIGLWISRRLQLEQVIKRPSFILVIFGFTTLLLTGNYIISAVANDLEVAHVDGGPRAIATTIWWAIIAIYMLYKGIKLGKKYHAEKLLGLLLLGITLIKVVLYDITNMGIQGQIIVLMIVGGAMLLFSYRVRQKNLIRETT